MLLLLPLRSFIYNLKSSTGALSNQLPRQEFFTKTKRD
ncbi:hypothetical protein STRDD11_02543 [Streptococcus sp. DD11]|nr:hypothetical protein STRDD11_02543 [Streptococcus sp. DD11]